MKPSPVGPEGLHGTLTNAGTGFVRDRQGRRRIHLQPAERLLLSRFDLRNDGFVFTSDEDVLEVFENSALATGWVLDFPPDANDLDFAAVSNVHLVLYAEAYHNERVASMVRAELAAAELHQHTLGLSLAAQYPDEFFGLQHDGEVVFTIDHAYLPFNHSAPLLRDLQIRIGSAGAGAQVRIEHAGSPVVTAPADADGMVGTDEIGPLNSLRGTPLDGEWKISLSGLDPETVEDIVLFAEYDFTPRGRPETRDRFDADPMTEFDVVTDADATVGGPAAWSYDPADRLIRQSSDVHGPGAAPTSVDKPGTYLVRKNWPLLRDLTVTARMRSDDPDGIGLVFRYQDPDNFYFLLMDADHPYLRLGKKTAGTFRELSSAAVDLQHGHPVGAEFDVAVSMVDDAVVVHLNGREVLRGRDGSLGAPGRVGFYSWANSQARFLDLAIRPV